MHADTMGWIMTLFIAELGVGLVWAFVEILKTPAEPSIIAHHAKRVLQRARRRSAAKRQRQNADDDN